MSTVKIVLYKGKKLRHNFHPIMIQLIHKSQNAIRLSTGYKSTVKNWDQERRRFKKSEPNAKKKNEVLQNLEIRAERVLIEIVKNNLKVTSKLFRELFFEEKKETTVFDFFETIREEKNTIGKLNTAKAYHGTKNAIKRFWNKKTKLYFEDIDYTFLIKFETFLYSTGCSAGGVIFYMRHLRAAMNEAIRRDYLDRSYYPFNSHFNKNGYSINKNKANPIPRALSIADMDKFKAFPSKEHPELKESWLYFLFSYYARGMNFTDMAHLKWSNLSNGRIKYTRKKTTHPITIKLNDNLQSIINEFKPKIGPYVFHILNDFHEKPDQQFHRITKKLGEYNKDLKLIADLCGIEEHITSYTARHTYATTLKAKDVPVSRISQGMGHKDESTTEAYLKRFEDSEIDDLDELL